MRAEFAFILLAFGVAPLRAQDAPAKAAPVIASRLLDAQSVIVVPTSPGITTTLQFPSAIQGVDGVGLAAKAGDGVLYHVSHTPGTAILSVSPSSPNSRTNMNVVVNGQVYVFVLAVNPDEALFKLKLLDPPPPPPDPIELMGPPEPRGKLAVSPTKLLGLLDKCKAYAALKHDDASHVADVREGKGPWQPSATDGLTITPIEVFRKGEWDALVMKLSLVNSGDTEVYYDPESFLVAVGPQSFRPILTDAAGTVKPKQQQEAWIVLQGDGAQGSNNLDTENAFTVTVQKLTEGPALRSLPEGSLLPPLSSSK